MAKQDDDACERDDAEVVVDVALPSDDDTAEVAQPGEDAYVLAVPRRDGGRVAGQVSPRR